MEMNLAVEIRWTSRWSDSRSCLQGSSRTFSAQESMKQQLHNMLEVPPHVSCSLPCGNYDPGIQMVVTPRAVRWISWCKLWAGFCNDKIAGIATAMLFVNAAVYIQFLGTLVSWSYLCNRKWGKVSSLGAWLCLDAWVWTPFCGKSITSSPNQNGSATYRYTNRFIQGFWGCFPRSSPRWPRRTSHISKCRQLWRLWSTNRCC